MSADELGERPSRPAWMPLLEPSTIRTRCAAVAVAVEANRSMHWRLDPAAMETAASQALSAWQQRGAMADEGARAIPPPWNTDGVDREGELRRALAALPVEEQARACIDLHVLVAVLQSAGAPPAPWAYEDRPDKAVDKLALPAARHAADDLLALLNQASSTSGSEAAQDTAASSGEATQADAKAVAAQPPAKRLTGGAGLAVAVLRAFMAGAFSADGRSPCRADPATLQHLDGTALRALLQSTPVNPVPALDAMAQRLSRLNRRPGSLLDAWLSQKPQDAAAMLQDVVQLTAPACGGATVSGGSVGDVFSHAWAGGRGATAEWVPLHHHAQKLLRQLLDHPCLAAAGLADVQGQALLTAAADLDAVCAFIDCGVLQPRDARDLSRPWPARHALVQEARAVALHLLHELAHRLHEASGGAGAWELQQAWRSERAGAGAGRRPLRLEAPA